MSDGGAAAPQAASHVAYAAVAALCAKYPAQEAALFQTYLDLRYAARWSSLEAVDVPRAAPTGDDDAFGGVGWAIIVGYAPSAKTKAAVVPMKIEQAFSTAMYVTRSPRLSEIFGRLPSDVDSSHVLLAMMSNDATVVYYKLSRGMVKPVN